MQKNEIDLLLKKNLKLNYLLDNNLENAKKKKKSFFLVVKKRKKKHLSFAESTRNFFSY